MESDERRPLLQFPHHGDSQETTVGHSSHPGKKLPQYIAAFSASLGALATGAIIGWSSPAGPKITDGHEYSFPVTREDNAWVASLTTLGAACICFPTGYLIEKIGRKFTMLLLILPFILGWLLIIFAENLTMLFFGRFIIGIAGGGYCVAVPAYTSEIAQDSIRGTLGTFFQLMVTAGVLFAFIVGAYLNIFVMSGLCAIIPLVFGITFIFMPESPYYLIYRNRLTEAKDSLKWLRGDQYDLQREFDEINNKVIHERENPITFKQSFSRKAAIKALIICLSLMIFQQFSGINAVLFNTTKIFNDAKVNISPKISTIIIGAVQVGATLLSTFAVDKLGRRILLLFSSIMMAICITALGAYFYLQDSKNHNQDLIDNLSWLPITSLCAYIIAFSLGFGPIPWLVSGELCTPDIKAFVGSFAGGFNWFLAFLITRYFEQMQADMGQSATFWFFGGTTLIGALFVFFVMPETKGRNLNEIQRILNGDISH